MAVYFEKKNTRFTSINGPRNTLCVCEEWMFYFSKCHTLFVPWYKLIVAEDCFPMLALYPRVIEPYSTDQYSVIKHWL